jgi:thiamine transport system ATP-binding protein
MLRLSGVEVRYGPTVALANVDLDVGTAEQLAVLGPSGSGKSTLLRAIAGLEPLGAGRVEWDGRDLSGVPSHRREFGLMFQDYALFPHRDVQGNVAFGLEMRGADPATITARVAEMLDLVGLSGYERRQVTQLSGGEQQRVALARALAPTPRLLMLDEPLGALDRALRTSLLTELAGLFAELRLPIIYVTHDQEEALAVGDRVAVLRAGRIEAVLTPAELWRSPPSEFVARFLGLGNIAPFEIAGDELVTPWGSLRPSMAPPAGQSRLLLRPDDLVPDPDGTIEAVVVAQTFRGDHTSLIVRAGDEAAPPLEFHLRDSALPAIGDRIRLRVDPSAIHFLP